MKRAYLLLALALTGAAAASAITVTQRSDTMNVFAERVDLAQHLTLGATRIQPAPGNMAAVSPVEMSPTIPIARTAVTRDHWTYTVQVREALLGSLHGGNVKVSLFVDGEPRGSVILEQEAPESSQLEGADVTFDIGPSLSPDALYYLEIKPFAFEGPTVSFSLKSVAGPAWKGVGGEIAGATNPTLTVPLGSTLRLTAQNDDSGFHNIGLKDGDAVVDPPGWSEHIDGKGESVTLAWTPEEAGTYAYVCQVHPGMGGGVTVTG